MCKICYELMEIMQRQVETILRQNDFITKLVNENLEKENYIEELSKDLCN